MLKREWRALRRKLCARHGHRLWMHVRDGPGGETVLTWECKCGERVSPFSE